MQRVHKISLLWVKMHYFSFKILFSKKYIKERDFTMPEIIFQ